MSLRQPALGALALTVALPGVLVAQPATAAPAAPTGVVHSSPTRAIATAAASTSKLVLPLASKTYRLTSARGPRCMPAVGATTEHLGQDMGADNNAPIRAVADGTVVATHDGDSTNSGYIVIESVFAGKKYQISYVHQWDGDKYYKVGQKVRAGARIGLVGSSGPATGPHLHLEVWSGGFMRGTALYPLEFLKKYGLDIAAGATANHNTAPPKTCTYYARLDTDVHSTASASAKTLKHLTKGAVVTSWPGAMSNKMLKVAAGGVTGYVAWNSMSPQYVAPLPPITYATDASLKGDTYATTANLNLRSTPRDGAVQRTAVKGTKVVTTGRTALSGTWYQVTVSGKTLWASKAYLKKVAEATKATPKPASQPTVTKPSVAKPSVTKPTTPKKTTTAKKPAITYATNSSLKGDTYATTAKLNLRSTPRDGAVKRTAAKGTKVVTTGRTALSGAWYQVTASGKTYWASKAYLKKVAEAKKASTPKHSAAVRHATANVWLRASPRTGKTLTVIKRSAAVTLTGSTKKTGGTTWYRVKYGSRTGWVSGHYLR